MDEFIGVIVGMVMLVVGAALVALAFKWGLALFLFLWAM